MSGLHTAKLPQIFNDIFEIVARMDISYVWIDSLCIMQDDPDDWNREASLMSQIYRNAYFTIAISARSTHTHLGLFHHHNLSPTLCERFYLPMNDESGREIVVMDAQNERETFWESPLLSRGWCFQERELSRRIIHYTGSQILWECRTLRASEAMPSGVGPDKSWPTALYSVQESNWPPRMLDINLSRESVEHVWHRAVEDYSARHLTRDTDKLPAIAGLAAITHAYKPAKCRYLAGLWEDEFVSGLAWARDFDIRGQYFWDRRYSEYVAPTWSWASVKGPISYEKFALQYVRPRYGRINEADEASRNSDSTNNLDPYNTEEHRHSPDYSMKILEIDVQPATVDVFGAVRPGAILRCIAWLIPATVTLDYHTIRLETTDRCLLVGEMIFDVDKERCDRGNVKLVFCVWLGVKLGMGKFRSTLGIAVIPTGNNPNEYRRVGFIEFSYHSYTDGPSWSSRDDFQAREITIV